MILGFAHKPRKSRRAFTITELVLAGGIIVLIAAAFGVFLQATGVSVVNVTTQSTFNQQAGHGTEIILNRLRLANTAATDPNGDVLTLTFDDNPDVDSDGDKTTWNDMDHKEQFRFEPTDGRSATLDDNRITYISKLGASVPSTLITSGVRKLPDYPVFSITNTATVIINFGLLYTNQTVHSQAIEIRTIGRLRNRVE